MNIVKYLIDLMQDVHKLCFKIYLLAKEDAFETTTIPFVYNKKRALIFLIIITVATQIFWLEIKYHRLLLYWIQVCIWIVHFLTKHAYQFYFNSLPKLALHLDYTIIDLIIYSTYQNIPMFLKKSIDKIKCIIPKFTILHTKNINMGINEKKIRIKNKRRKYVK